MSVPLVLVPGMNCSRSLWDPVLTRLDVGSEVIHRQVAAPSMPLAIAQILAGLPTRFDLVGLSLGGIAAMALTRTAPERVRRLALLSTSARPPTAEQVAAWAASRKRLTEGATARDEQQRIMNVLLRDPTPEQQEQTLTMADEVGADVLAAQLACQATRIDERPALERIACPALVLAAADDALCPISRHAEIADRIPGADLVVIPDSGHLSPLQSPSAVAGALRAWLR